MRDFSPTTSLNLFLKSILDLVVGTAEHQLLTSTENDYRAIASPKYLPTMANPRSE